MVDCPLIVLLIQISVFHGRALTEMKSKWKNFSSLEKNLANSTDTGHIRRMHIHLAAQAIVHGFKETMMNFAVCYS